MKIILIVLARNTTNIEIITLKGYFTFGMEYYKLNKGRKL
jgi:hypothetical protein